MGPCQTRHPATDLKFLDGSEVVDTNSIRRLAETFDASPDRIEQASMRVVVSDYLGIGHLRPPIFHMKCASAQVTGEQ